MNLPTANHQPFDSHGEPLERCELYRVLAEPMRLRMLALVAEEELTVGELADLTQESQPNVSRHAAPLRAAGLVDMRKQGTRVLLRLAREAQSDPVVEDALFTGKSLCTQDGSLARIPNIVRMRESAGRAFFAKQGADRPGAAVEMPKELTFYLKALSPLVQSHRVAIDAGCGDGGLTEIISPLFFRVIAFDREAVRVEQCRQRLTLLAYNNVDLICGEADSPLVRSHIVEQAPEGADVLFASRLLHHTARPLATLESFKHLLKPGAWLLILDYAHHDEERMHDEGDLWLGFEKPELLQLAKDAGFTNASINTLGKLPLVRAQSLSDGHLSWILLSAQVPD